MRFWLPRALLAILAVVLLAEFFIVIPRFDALVLLLVAAWVVAPGIALARVAFGSREPSRIAAWLIGPSLGSVFSVFGVFVLWSAGLQNWLALIAGPALTWVLVWLAFRSGGLALRLPVFDRRDIVAVAIALAVVPLVTWRPYDRVREAVPEGDAYRAYFTADFVWALTVTSELSKGDVPPVNPFLPGQTLHYYWMAHFLSGAEYRNVESWGILAEQVVLVNGLVFGLSFVAFFYALARMAGASAVFAAASVLIGFLANSYEGLARVWLLREAGESMEMLRDTNIDAVTRWFYQSMPVDGLQRLLLYQPHHLAGYAAALAALWVVTLAEDAVHLSIAIACGVLLALTFLFSTFTTLIVGPAVAIVYMVRLLPRRQFGALVMAAIVGIGIAALGALLTRLLGYTEVRAGLMMVFGPNPTALRRWPFALFLSFGPLLFFGVAGLLRVTWVLREGLAVMTLVIVALAFYFLVDVPDMEGVWVGWRSGHQLLVAFSISTAVLLTVVWRHRAWRIPVLAALIVAAVPAVPTVAIDVYNAQDIENRHRGPTFPWTLILTPDEREALDWIKHKTPKNALVQFDPWARGTTWWATIPAFGERRMAAGLPGAMIPFQKFKNASDTVRLGVFRAPNAHEAWAMADFLGVDYVYVGDAERVYYRANILMWNDRPDLFPIAFRNGMVTIYGVNHAAPTR